MRIIGIDPGYDRLGIAIIEGERGAEKIIHSECFTTDKKVEFVERLSALSKRVEEVFDEYKPDVLVIETLYVTNNQKTAMRVSEARGCILLIAHRSGAKIFEIGPIQVKSAIGGDGRAGKAQVERMVRLLMPKLGAKTTHDDEFDAIAIALAGSAYRGIFDKN